MNQLELLRDMAKAGFTFGRDQDEGTWLRNESLYNDLEKWTSTLWGDKLYYSWHTANVANPRMQLRIEGFETQHIVWLEDDELNVDRVIAGVIHMYTWIP
jgi:hypothetical protein